MQVAGDASLEVELQARNAVTGIEVCESSLPADGITAGAGTVITAQVTIAPQHGMRFRSCHFQAVLPCAVQLKTSPCAARHDCIGATTSA